MERFYCQYNNITLNLISVYSKISLNKDNQNFKFLIRCLSIWEDLIIIYQYYNEAYSLSLKTKL